MRFPGAPVLVTAAALTLAACDGIQSMTGGDGFHGRQFNSLFTLFMVVTGLSLLLVIAFLAGAVLRRSGRKRDGTPEAEAKHPQPRMNAVLVGWIAFIVIGLTILTLASFFADRDAAKAAAHPDPLRITVTANQWWWDVQYEDALPSNIFRTANELHLPAGVPAKITLKSNDVIHSFWVPNLAGKQDLIPGRTVDIDLLPRNEGIYRGECAEFCGTQHAHMALDVTVESPAEFAAWRGRQQAPASPPPTRLATAGHAYFIARECAMCHNVTGTPASGRVGPDLTHFASRRSIAAGTYPMTRGHLYGWIADPQSAKPGNRMPTVGLSPDELHALAAYMESLK